jgi:broad specificity phosphatase PhoE
MRRRIYLMRHAEVAYFADPERPVAPEKVRLTESGLEQARAAGRALAEVRLDRVITSGLERTVQTARLVVEQLAHPPAEPELEAWPDLEEMRGGEVGKIPDEELEAAFLTAFRRTPPPDTAFLGGETVGSLVERVGAAMERLHADQSWHTILLVLHGGVNRAVISWTLAGRGAFLGHLEQSPACINIIDGGPEFVVRAVNITPYDPVHLGPRSTTVEQMLDQYRDYRARM